MRHERDYASLYNACVFRFLLTAFIYIRRDVDGGGVVGNESFEVRVYVEIIWNISFIFSFCFLRLVKLHKRRKNFRNHPTK